mmetsp:Transcript_17367/g.29134  ORF Transcript_17367/g.29134 Transcript_17367/m.29134 type:complete len:401 (+) Transcript_17367:90-1292(+)
MQVFRGQRTCFCISIRQAGQANCAAVVTAIILASLCLLNFVDPWESAVDQEVAHFMRFTSRWIRASIESSIRWDVRRFSIEEKRSMSHEFSYENFAANQSIFWNSHKGCTKIADSYLIVNVRTPKAASSTLASITQKLAAVNKFVENPLDTPSPYRGKDNSHREEQMCKYFSSLPQRTATTGHLRFMDFAKFGLPIPPFVGTIRDPVRRMQSHYNYDFFAKRPWHAKTAIGVNQDSRSHSPLYIPKFRECIRAHMNGTAPPHYQCLSHKYVNVQLRYYCGIDEFCTNSSPETVLKRAIYNMNKYFRVVIIVEDIANSILLLEEVVPTFYTGASQIYNASTSGGGKAIGLRSNMNTKVNRASTHLPTDIRNYVSKILVNEIVLYKAALLHHTHNLQQCNFM